MSRWPNGRERHLYPLPRLETLGFSGAQSDYRQGTTFAAIDERPLLSVRDLQVRFPSDQAYSEKVERYVKAVDGVDFDVYRGQTLGLVGESGCGKTTTGRAVMRLIEPTGGTVNFDGTDITTMSQQELRSFRKRFQIIFQDPYGSLNPRKTIETTIMEPMEVTALVSPTMSAERWCSTCWTRLSFPERATSTVTRTRFSGGQRQRICIARSLAVRLRSIICDKVRFST